MKITDLMHMKSRLLNDKLRIEELYNSDQQQTSNI